MGISAYVPCYNNKETIAEAVRSIQEQTTAVDELFVIDDGSTDGSAEVVEGLGVRVIRHGRRLGRGAARARAMEEARHPSVVSCDATIALEGDFVSKAARWLEDERVAAAGGRIQQREARTAADRWRGRHLFRTGKEAEFQEHAAFVTAGTMVRAAAVREAGGYDVNLSHGEDAELGRRFVERGYKVIFDPEMTYWQMGSNSMGEVLERYWRWNRAQGRMSFLTYLKQIKYSVTVMAAEDLETADVGAAMISLISPHYQYWRDRRR
jgi:GT2 family glycosyltransferase